ncbi:hypothetical protein Tco_0841996 [Tanacetum coccineum]|uniref:Uncharacterized protein n=1 Tax=Tanacetum coccineum TaxID=301880 RepID=A0ABQ5AZU1_9ASTR
MDYKRTQEYLPRIHRTRRMDEDLKESYRTLEKCLFHKGRLVTPYFIEANNMLPSFHGIGLEPFLTLNEPICPRFVVEFYHSLKVKRDEEEHPYIKFKLGQFTFNNFFGAKPDLVKNNITIHRTNQTQLERSPNKLHIDDIRPDLRGWELFFRENFFCSLGERNKDPLDIQVILAKNKGNKIASPLVTSSSSSSSDDNEAPSFLEFYDELSNNEDLTKAQREKRGMFKCLNRYIGTITKYLKKQE